MTKRGRFACCGGLSSVGLRPGVQDLREQTGGDFLKSILSHECNLASFVAEV